MERNEKTRATLAAFGCALAYLLAGKALTAVLPQVPEDAARTSEVFDLLLGDNLQGRKDHIAENGARFLDLADIS